MRTDHHRSHTCRYFGISRQTFYRWRRRCDPPGVVLVLLSTAQKLLNQPGRLSGVYVTPTSPAAADQVAKGLRNILGDTVEVTPLARRQQ